MQKLCLLLILATTQPRTDVTPPQVQGRNPSAGSIGLPLHAAITVSFNEPMKTTSINDSTFRISGGVRGTVTATATRATFQPNWPLRPNTVYTVTLTSGIQDVAGNALTPTSWTFTTETDPRHRIHRKTVATRLSPTINLEGELEAGSSVIGKTANAWSPAPNTERYQSFENQPIRQSMTAPLSTFSIDVDTGSYSNVRRFLKQGQLPPIDAVRVEELMNYFPYQPAPASKNHPFGIDTELAPSAWNKDRWVLKVSVAAHDVEQAAVPSANLVFLVDVSGSMSDDNKLPLLKKALGLLVNQLREQDRVSLVTYAGNVEVVLPPTPGNQHHAIRTAISGLGAGGSTSGEAGIHLAYQMARQAFIPNGINRVFLATDGDFNVGLSDTGQLKSLIAEKRKTGISLSTLGFGAGNYNEHLMEQLADVGDGNYSYIDTLQEGRKVLVEQMRSTLLTVAKDVKIQVEFNPAVVAEYRLVGYENRMLQHEDFNDDAVDAGEVGAGTTVTALYELTPVGAKTSIDALRYGPKSENAASHAPNTSEVAFVRVRYKKPSASQSQLLEFPVKKASLKPSLLEASEDFRFVTAVAGFGLLLRRATVSEGLNFDSMLTLASQARGKDEFGYRAEFLSLLRLAQTLHSY